MLYILLVMGDSFGMGGCIRGILICKVMKANAPEYIRADAFIDKAAEWIKNKAENYIVDTPLCSYFDYKRAVEDFRKHMKGE